MSTHNETPQEGNPEGHSNNSNNVQNIQQYQSVYNVISSEKHLEMYSNILPSRGLFCLAYPNPKGNGFIHRFYPTVSELLNAAMAFDSHGTTVYTAQASFNTTENRKGTNVCAVRSFWFDIDCGEGKPYATQREAAADLIRFCTETGLPLPTVVNSGNGLYAHWALTYDIMPDQWKGTASILKKLTVAHDFHDDPMRTADISSVLRPAGSHNRKDPDNPKNVVCGTVQPPVDFIMFAATIAEAAKKKKIEHNALLPPKKQDINAEFEITSEYPTSSALRIADQCQQIARIRDTKGNVSEPEWYAGIGVLRNTVEGASIIHEWSSGYPDYTPEETDKKIKQHKVPPTTCAHYKSLYPSGCEGCQHSGKIKSPIILGYDEEENIPDYVTKMNTDYFVTRDAGKTVVCHETTDPVLNRSVLIRSSFADYKNFHNNRLVITGTDSKGNPKYTPLGTAWLTHPKRRQFSGIVMSPSGEVIGYYNLWRGFSVKSVNGSWRLIRQHILEVICDNNTINFNYLICWLARMFQYPEKLAEVAVVLQGGRGTGKGVFGNAVCRILGHHAIQVTHGKHVTGNFNAHLEDCLFLFADEAFWAGDKQAENVLKGLVTEPTITIERKGIDLKVVPNMLHILMASNNDWVVPAGTDERRYFVLKVSGLYAQNHKYFAALMDEINNGGLEAMLHELLQLDITGFNVRDVPATAGLAEQKEHSLDSVLSWWLQKLINGEIPFAASWELVPFKTLYEDYLDSAKNIGSMVRRANEVNFAKTLRKVLPTGWPKISRLNLSGSTVRAKHYELPPLEECRASWESYIGCKRDWGDMS